MKWSIDEAVELLKRTFPGMSVVIADGESDYLVGTIEDDDEAICGSFLLFLDSSGKLVHEIRISEGQQYCGVGAQPTLSESSRYFVPISITRREENGTLWGMVGDYEVCVNNEMIDARAKLATGVM